jgi:hypothetical protein
MYSLLPQSARLYVGILISPLPSRESRSYESRYRLLDAEQAGASSGHPQSQLPVGAPGPTFRAVVLPSLPPLEDLRLYGSIAEMGDR